ncbi:hypothetical protein JMJ56_24215 [Belnapia sp. T18]|uniref:Uncharacterized protein n=1 Tax=Belnapia arida TaxID=2804533 RepID=A0ABS1U8V3_9PROT|nr:hypothetical protein [Belnapia arida]MBL6081113.1 hypothetical protein [Belnapia arida]
MDSSLSGTFSLLPKQIDSKTLANRVAALFETGETDKACADGPAAMVEMRARERLLLRSGPTKT